VFPPVIPLYEADCSRVTHPSAARLPPALNISAPQFSVYPPMCNSYPSVLCWHYIRVMQKPLMKSFHIKVVSAYALGPMPKCSVLDIFYIKVVSAYALGPMPKCSVLKSTPLDLHVLGTPPAFVLSQDQTLQLKCPSPISRSERFNCFA